MGRYLSPCDEISFFQIFIIYFYYLCLIALLERNAYFMLLTFCYLFKTFDRGQSTF